MNLLQWASDSSRYLVLIFSFVSTRYAYRLLIKKKLQERLVRDSVARNWFDGADYFLGIVLTLLVTSWKLYDIDAWSVPKPGFTWAAGALGFLVSLIIHLKHLKARLSNLEKATVTELEELVDQATASRNWLLRLDETIDEVVEGKREARVKALSKPKITPADLLSSEATISQINIIVSSIHDFFASMAPLAKLRLGIYYRSESSDSLTLAYSWDGTTEACFSDKGKEYLSISRKNGVFSQLAICYNSREGFILVQDCESESKRADSTFEYLYPAQKEYLKSLLIHRFNVPIPDSVPWLIYLDSNQVGFFDCSRTADFKVFLERFADRLAFEIVSLKLASKFEAQLKNPEKRK